MWALLPLKRFSAAKQRLAGVLSPAERRSLVLAMASDVLDTLSRLTKPGTTGSGTTNDGGFEGAARLQGIAVLSAEPEAEELAQRYGARFIAESPQSEGESSGPLNNAIRGAVQNLAQEGIRDVLVVPGDVPMLAVGELARFIDVHARHGGTDGRVLTIAPDRWRHGTNLLAWRPLVGADQQAPGFEARYGLGSLKHHLAQAVDLGFDAVTHETSSASLDVDEPEDLRTVALYLAKELAPHTRAFLDESGITARLRRQSRSGRIAVTHAASSTAQANDHEQTVTDQASLRPHGSHGTSPLRAPEQESPGNMNDSNNAGAQRPDVDILALADQADLHGSNIDTAVLQSLMSEAAALRDAGFGELVTYSRKVFIPLTQLCRDVCHYCTFAQTPSKLDKPYMSADEVVAIVKDAATQGCKEALFTLGERPELRYAAAREALKEMGFASTLEYTAHVARRVLEETGVLPHINAGTMSAEEIAMLRPVSASMGIMLESASERLCGKGMPHHGSPDKVPAVRLDTMRLAGEAGVPFTSGILIGIGETRRERVESLMALRDLHRQHGHIQEVIIQNFRAKPGTLMVNSPEPSLDELLWTIAVARLLFGPAMSIQVPPNLNAGQLEPLIAAGINDWGGVSPVTPDFVNPEAPWPHLKQLASETAAAGKILQERLTIYPKYVQDAERWLDEGLRTRLLRMIDAEGYPRTDEWLTGSGNAAPQDPHLVPRAPAKRSAQLSNILSRARNGERLSESDVVRLFAARGDEFFAVCEAADQLRRQVSGERVGYVVNRNINYTNVCTYKCSFCAFSKGSTEEHLRGKPYDLAPEEITRRTNEAWARGATEVCMQGGIHPGYSGDTYLDIIGIVKRAIPDMHVHAFSPLEIWQGANTLNMELEPYIARLKEAGLGTLPGTAAEILDDEVRAVLCPDKINTGEWLQVVEAAHNVGVRTTSTIMYGHVERTVHWARHLLRLRDLQARTGGITEFVPLPFVASEAPMYLRGKARLGPTWREAVLMHAVARLALHPHITNIQTSWVKMGEAGVAACLAAGANDMGGTLMNESITRAAGAQTGQEMPPASMDALIRSLGREPYQRSTLYGAADPAQTEVSYRALPLTDIVNTPLVRIERRARKQQSAAQ
jgi:FO synthase